MRRLITIPGVDATTAATMMATIGRIQRFPTPRQLVGYVGLDARVRQSGNQPSPPRADLQARHLRRPSRARPGRLGRDQDARARCAPSTGASRPAAAPRSRSSPSPASSPSSPGTYSPSNRTTPTNARCSSPASSAGSSSRPAPHDAAAARLARPNTDPHGPAARAPRRSRYAELTSNWQTRPLRA